MLNWNDLRIFVAIARSGTFAGAAKELAVDQTTVSRRLSALEQELGAQLFVKTRDGVTLTSAGKRSLAAAADLDERVGLFETLVRGSDDRVEGVVRVAMNDDFSIGFFLERLVRVRERHPGLRLEIVTSRKSVNILRREADVAIRVAPRALPQQQGLVVRKLGSLALALYATRGYLDAHPAVDVKRRLRGHDVILYEEEIAQAPPGRWLAAHATNAHPVLSVSSLLGAAAAASAGAGLALLPCFMKGKYPALVRATRAHVVESDAWLLVHPELHSTARVRAVVDHIVSEMKGAKPLVRGLD